MNLYALAGTRENPEVLALVLDNNTQAAVTALLSQLVDGVLSSETVSFEAGYKPDDGENTTLTPFVLTGALSPLTNTTAAAALRTLDPANVEALRIRALAAVEWAGDEPSFVAFQRLEQRYVLRRERPRLMFAQGRFVLDERPGLEVPERVDAVLQGDTLHVASWPRAQAILDLTSWMREATVSEMERFFKHKKLTLADGFSAEALADTVVRRKIASITDRKLLDKCGVQALRNYAAQFDVEIQVSKGRIILPATKKDFKAVLALLDEDFLSFDPTGERWFVNSKRRAKS